MLPPQERRDAPFIRTLNVDTTNRPGTYRHIADALDAVEDGIRTLIVVAAGTYELHHTTLTIGGSQQAKTKKSLDVEIRGAPDAVPVLTSKQTALHISLPAPVPPSSSSLLHTPAADNSIGVASSSSSPLPPLVVISGIRIESTNPLFPAVLVSGGAPLFIKASIQSMHLDNDATYAFVDNCKITDSPSTGLLITGGANCDVKKSEFRRALLYNIMFDCTTSPVVSGCSFFESGRGAMVICGSARCAPIITKCIIQDLALGSQLAAGAGGGVGATVDPETGAIIIKTTSTQQQHQHGKGGDAMETSGSGDSLMTSASVVEGSRVPRAAIVIGGAARPTIEDNTIFGGAACGLAVYPSTTYAPHRVVSLDVAMNNVTALMAAKRAFVSKKKKAAPPTGMAKLLSLAAPAPDATVAPGGVGPSSPGEGDPMSPLDAASHQQQDNITEISSSSPKVWKLGDLDSLPRGDPSTKVRKNVIRDNAMYGVLVQGDTATLSISRCDVNRNGQGGCVAEDDGKLFVYTSTLQLHTAPATASNTSNSNSNDNSVSPPQQQQRAPACWAKEGVRSLIRLNDCKVQQNQIGCLVEHGARIVFEYSCLVEDCECGLLVRHSGIVDAQDTKFIKCSVAVHAETTGGGLIQRCVVESNGLGYTSASGGNPTFTHTPFRRNGTAMDIGIKGRGTISNCTISDSTGSVSQIILGERANPHISHCEVKSASSSAIVCKPMCKGTFSHCTFTGHKGLEVVKCERASEVVIEHCRFIGAERNTIVFHEGAGGTVLHSEISSAIRAGVVAKAMSEPTLRANKIHFNSIGVELLPASVVMLEKNILAENTVANIQTSGVPPPPASHNNNNSSTSTSGPDLSKLPVRADWQPYISTISKNEIIGGQIGVQVLTGARTVISRNVFLRCSFGVYAGGNGQSEKSRVACTGNEFRRNTCAIALLGGETTAGVFIGNVIRESLAVGMWVGKGAAPTVVDNIFMGHFAASTPISAAVVAPPQSSSSVPKVVSRSTSPQEADASNIPRLTSVPLRLDALSCGSFGRNRFLFNLVSVVAHPSTTAVFMQNCYAQNELGFVYCGDMKRFVRYHRGGVGTAAVVSPTTQSAPPIKPTPPASFTKKPSGNDANDVGTPPDLPTTASSANFGSGGGISPSTTSIQAQLSNYIDTTVLDIHAQLDGLLELGPSAGNKRSTRGGAQQHNALPEILQWAIPLDNDEPLIEDDSEEEGAEGVGVDGTSSNTAAAAASPPASGLQSPKSASSPTKQQQQQQSSTQPPQEGEEDMGGPILLGDHFVENITSVVAAARSGTAPLCLDGCVFLNTKAASVEVVHRAVNIRVTNCFFHHAPQQQQQHQQYGGRGGGRNSFAAAGSDESGQYLPVNAPPPTRPPRVLQPHHILFSGAEEDHFVADDELSASTGKDNSQKLKHAANAPTSTGFSAVVNSATQNAKAAAAASAAIVSSSSGDQKSGESSLRESVPTTSRRLRSLVAHCIFYGASVNLTFDQGHSSASVFGCSFIASGVLSLHNSFPLVVACSFIGYPLFVKKLVDAQYCKASVDYVTDPTSMQWCLGHGAFERTSRIPLARDSFVGTRAVSFTQGGSGVVTQCSISLYQEGIVFDDAALLVVPESLFPPTIAGTPRPLAVGGRNGTLDVRGDAATATTTMMPHLTSMVNRCVVTRCRDAAIFVCNGGIRDDLLDTLPPAASAATAPMSTNLLVQQRALDKCVIAHNYGVGILARGRCGGASRTTVQPPAPSDVLVRSPTAGRGFTAQPPPAAQQQFSSSTPRKASTGGGQPFFPGLNPTAGAQVTLPTTSSCLFQSLLVAAHTAVPLLPYVLLPPPPKTNTKTSGRAIQQGQPVDEQALQKEREREAANLTAIDAHAEEAKSILLCNVARDRAYNGNEKNPQQPPVSSTRYPVRYGMSDQQHHKGHGVGVWVDPSGALALHNCALVGSSVANIIFSGRMPCGLSRCLIAQSEGYGVVVRGGASPAVYQTLLGQNGYAGALLDPGSRPTFEHSLFLGNRVGLYASAVDDATRLRWCTFYHHDICAIRAVDGSRFVVDRCAVEHNRGGIDIAASPVLVRACAVLFNKYCGVVVSGNCGAPVRANTKSGVPQARYQQASNIALQRGRAEATLVSCVLRGNQIAGVALRNGAITSMQKCLIESNAINGIASTNYSLLRCVECTVSRNGVGVVVEYGSRGVVTQSLFSRNVDRSFLSKTNANVRVAGNLFLDDAPVGVCLEGKGTFTNNTFRKPKSNCFLVSQGGEPRILNTRFVLMHGGTADVLHAKLLEERNLDTMMDVMDAPGGRRDNNTPEDDLASHAMGGIGGVVHGRGLLDRIKTGQQQQYYLDNDLNTFVMPVDHQAQSDDGSSATPFLVNALGGNVSPLPDQKLPSPSPSALQSPQPLPPLAAISIAQQQQHGGGVGTSSGSVPSRALTAMSHTGSGTARPLSTSPFPTSQSFEAFPPPPDVSAREDDHIDVEKLVDGKVEKEFGAFERAELVSRTSVTALRRRSSVSVHRTTTEAARRKSYSQQQQHNLDLQFEPNHHVVSDPSSPAAEVSVAMTTSVRGNTPSTATSPTLAGSTSTRPRRAHRASFFLPNEDGAENNSVVSGVTSPGLPPSREGKADSTSSSVTANGGVPKALSLKNIRQRRISSHRLDVDFRGGSKSVGGNAATQQQQLTQLQKDLISDQRDDILAASAMNLSGIDVIGGDDPTFGGGGGTAGGNAAVMDHTKVPIIFEGGGSGVVARCVFAHNQPCSILCDGPGACPTIETSLFYDHRLCAVVVTGNAGARIEQNYFTRNANAVQAFYADGPKLLLEKNLFRFNLAAFEALEGDCGTIRRSTHYQDEHSILCGSGAVVKLQDSSFVSCNDAIVGEPNSIFLMDHVDILGCIEAITLQSDEPTTVNPVGHADDTTEVLRHVSVRCCVNGIRIGNRRDVQVQNCSVNTCALVGIELTAPPSSSILSNVPSSVMVVDSTVQGCRSGIHLDGEACMPIFGSSSGGTGGDGTTSFYGSAALATRGEGGCSVSFCGSGVTVTNGSVPRMEHLTIRQCVKGLVVSEHATGLFRRIEISGCEAGVQVSTGDEEYPTFQHCLIYDCPVVGVYLDRRAAGQVIDSTIFECGVGVMFTEGSYSYLAHTKISHPSNNTISKKNDAMRVAKYATPRLGPGIDMQYESSPSHNSRTARMRRTDREKEREAYQEDVLPKLMAEWDSKKTAISERAETFLESFGMRGRCMMTLPLPVVTALQVPDDATLMLHPSSGRFPIAGAGSSSNTRGNLFAANVVDLDTPHRSGGGGAGVVIPHSNSGKFVYAIEASGAVLPLSLMVPSEFNEIPTIATSPQNSNTAPTQPQQPILPCWTVHATRQAIFDACTAFDEKEATLVLLGSGSGATSALSTPPPELASTASSGLQQRRLSPPPVVASAKQTTGAVATSTLPIGVPQITPLPTMKHHVAGNVALSASPSEVLVGTPGGANESLDDDRLITTTSLLDPTDESNSTNKAPQHWVMSVFPLPALPRHVGPTWASRKNREGPLSSEGAGTLGGLASRNNQSNYALDAILKERATTTTSPPLPRSANVSSGEESDDVSDDGPPQPPSATRSPSTAALRGQQHHRYHHHHHEDQTDASHASLFAAHLRRRGSEIANVYTVKELQSMEDHAEDDVAIQLGLHHRHASAAGEALAASLPLLPPIKIAPPPGKPYYPTSAGLQFAEAQHQLKLKGDGNQPSAAMSTTGSRSLPPLPSQRTLRLLQRPQTNLLTPEIADELAYITTQHNSIYAQQILTIFTRLDARHCGGATSTDCRRFLRQLLVRCEGGDASGGGGGGGNGESSESSSDSSGDEGDVAELPPGTLEAAAATNATPASATAKKKKKKRKASFGSSARRRRSSSKKTAAAVHYPLVEGFVIPPKVLFDAQQQQRRRIQRSASVAAAGVSPSESATTTLLGAPTQLEASSNGSRPVTRESTTPVPPGDEQQQTAVPPPPPPKPAAVILSPATIDSIVLKLIVNQLFESVHKIPETDILTLSEFEQLLSTHQRLKQSGRLPAAIQTTFPWMGMPQPMVEGGEEPTAAAPAQELFRGNVNRGGSQIQPRSGKDSDVVPLGRLNRENAR